MKTIRSKIRVTVLILALLALLLTAAVTLIGMNGIRQDVIEASNDLGSTAGETSATALETQMLNQLSVTAETKATLADEKLGKQQIYTQMLADSCTKLYSSTLAWAERSALPPDPRNAGQFSAQLLYAEGVWPESVAQELSRTANLTDLMLLIPQQDSDMTADYVATESGFLIMVDQDSAQKPAYFDGRARAWYQSAKANNALIWTEPFNDAMGRGLAITCAAPYHDASGTVRGVVGIGALMSHLNEEIIQTKLGRTGYAFVVNQEGDVLLSPKLETAEDGTPIPQNILQEEDGKIQTLVKDMLEGTAGVAQVHYRGRDVYMACQPMKTQPWGVVTVMDVSEAQHPVSQLQNQISQMTNTAVTAVDQSVLHAVLAIVLIVILVVALVFWSAGYLAKSLTNPLAQLTAGVESISNGALDTELDLRTGDEIEVLAQSFNSMTGSLRQYISDLTAVTAEKERIGAELNVATQIQASMLPCIFPAFPEHGEFDIYATMQPAKEVGGDFYDFFLVDEKHLGMIMADVSGKGVPAALFMVIAKTLIKNHAQNGESPAEILTAVNDQLCENNDAAMFVTAWMGILDIESGHLVYGNAGHNPPLLKRAAEDGFSYLNCDPGFVLAGLEGMCYEEAALRLEQGDVLYLYTDGVTEATNPQEELFGEARLQAILNAHATDSMQQLLPAVRAAIDVFADGADQFDDITMLGLQFKGKDGGLSPAERSEA